MFNSLFSIVLAGVFALLGLTATGYAQDSAREELVRDPVDHNFRVRMTTKVSSVDGSFANFLGANIALGMNDRFDIGLGAYGLTNGLDERTMGYGGVVLGYHHRPSELVHLSIGGLIGGGNVTFVGGRDHLLFVAEPEARMTLNVSRNLDLAFGVGYRFVGNAGDSNGSLSGWSGSFGLGFTFFRDSD